MFIHFGEPNSSSKNIHIYLEKSHYTPFFTPDITKGMDLDMILKENNVSCSNIEQNSLECSLNEQPSARRISNT